MNAGFDLLPALSSSSQFQAISAYQLGWLVVEGRSNRASIIAAAVDPGFFEVLGIEPTKGRVFSSDNGSMQTSQGAVLTAGLFQRLFGSEHPLEQASLRTGSLELSVLGTVPDHPVYPPLAELWVLRHSATRLDRELLPSQVPRSGMLARLSTSSSIEAARDVLKAATHEFETARNIHQGDVELISLTDVLRRRSGAEGAILRTSLGGLLAFVLLAQISILSSFIMEKEKEFAIRCALGARWAHLMSLFLREVAMLAMPGIFLGLPISIFVLSELRSFVPLSLSELIPPRVDLESLVPVTIAWLAIQLLSALAVWVNAPSIGLAPILTQGRSEARNVRTQTRLLLILVGAALSLSVALGTGTEMLRQSLFNLQSEPLGFEPRSAVSGVIRFAEPLEPADFGARLERITASARQIDGIAAISFSDALPFGGSEHHLEVTSPESSVPRLARARGISGDYLEATGIRMLAGRDISPLEQVTGAPVALIDETAARLIFGRAPCIGKIILLLDRPLEIVGVVAATKATSLDESSRPQVLLPLRLALQGKEQKAVAMIARLSAPILGRELRAVVADVGGSLDQYQPVVESVEASLAVQELAKNMASVQWMTTLALIALTIFGTMSWLLRLRSHELAVRLALGDTPLGLARRILGNAIRLGLVSLLLGLALALPVGYLLRALLFGVEVLSPNSLLRAAAKVAGVVLIAAAIATASALRQQSFEPLKARQTE